MLMSWTSRVTPVLAMLAACASPSTKSAGEVTLAPVTSSGDRTPLVHVEPIAPTWQWSGPELGSRDALYREPRKVTEGTVSCTFTYDARTSRATTACASRGVELWHHDEERAFEDAAMVLGPETLYCARYSNVATGCVMHAFDVRTGVERWSRPVMAIGAIGRGEYANAVELRMIRKEPVAFGWETGGRYIEVMDPVTGKTASHVVIPVSP